MGKLYSWTLQIFIYMCKCFFVCQLCYGWWISDGLSQGLVVALLDDLPVVMRAVNEQHITLLLVSGSCYCLLFYFNKSRFLCDQLFPFL